jgi:hypothetical protein
MRENFEIPSASIRGGCRIVSRTYRACGKIEELFSKNSKIKVFVFWARAIFNFISDKQACWKFFASGLPL